MQQSDQMPHLVLLGAVRPPQGLLKQSELVEEPPRLDGRAGQLACAPGPGWLILHHAGAVPMCDQVEATPLEQGQDALYRMPADAVSLAKPRPK